MRFASTTPTAPPATPATPIANAPTGSTPAEAASSSAASTPSEYVASLDSATDFATDSLYNMPEHIGYLKSLGLDYGYGPTSMMEWVLEHVHIFTGTPWWISIALTAVLVRIVLFKPYIDAAENATKMAKIMPIIKPITTQMTEAQRAGDMDRMLQLRSELSLIKQRAGVKMWKSFVPMLNAVTGIGTFILLRAMSKLPVPGLETGGILWFYNLALPDPYFILPIATAGILHWMLRRGGEMGTSTMSPAVYKILIWAFPALSLLCTWWQPAALTLSFFVTGVMSYAQAILFHQAWFRRYFNMTSLPTSPTPLDQAPPSPYKGKLKVTANPVLSQAELSSRFQSAQANTRLQSKVSQIRDNRPPVEGRVTKFVSSKFTGVSNTVGEITEAVSGVTNMAKEKLDQRKTKADQAQAKAYEAKRQRELRKEELERANERRMERATRKTRR